MTSRSPLAVVSADKEIIELVQTTTNYHVVGFFDADKNRCPFGLSHLGDDSNWNEIKKKYADLKVVIAVDPPRLRIKLTQHYGLENMPQVISPRAYISQTARIGLGTIIQNGVGVYSDATVGNSCKVNVNATVHHDCQVGDYCTLAPGAHLLGYVTVGSSTFIGANATILPHVTIGQGCFIGAGAVVTKDVPDNTVMAGVPARTIESPKIKLTRYDLMMSEQA